MILYYPLHYIIRGENDAAAMNEPTVLHNSSKITGLL